MIMLWKWLSDFRRELEAASKNKGDFWMLVRQLFLNTIRFARIAPQYLKGLSCLQSSNLFFVLMIQNFTQRYRIDDIVNQE